MCHDITLTELCSVQAYSLFKYVPRCVVVPDDDFTAVWANPHSVRQLKFIVLMTAVIAYLGRCEESSSLYARLIIEQTLIVYLPVKFSDACIRQCPRNLVIAHHTGNESIFSENDIEPRYEICSHLLSIVFSDISHVLAILCERNTCFFMVTTSHRRILRYVIRISVSV